MKIRDIYQSPQNDRQTKFKWGQKKKNKQNDIVLPMNIKMVNESTQVDKESLSRFAIKKRSKTKEV